MFALHPGLTLDGFPIRNLWNLEFKLNPELLMRFPEGYRHLAYLQTKIGFKVKIGLPGLRGPEVERLYAEGKAWLAGSTTPGEPL